MSPSLVTPGSTRWYVVFDGDPDTDQRAVAALAERFPAARYTASITGVDRMDSPRLYSDLIAHGTWPRWPSACWRWWWPRSTGRSSGGRR